MKLFIILFLLLTAFLGHAQTITAHYKGDSRFAENFIAKIEQLPLARKIELMSQYDGLKSYYTVKCDGRIAIRNLDSITQKCDVSELGMYPYTQTLIKQQAGWSKFLSRPNNADNRQYEIKEPKEEKKWVADYQSTKNILGYTCFYAKNRLNDEEWAWFTLEIPATVFPAQETSLPGVILEFHNRNAHYHCQKITIEDLGCDKLSFEKDSFEIITVERFREFSDILMNQSYKISTADFECHE